MSALRVNSGTAKRISRRHREWYSVVAKCGARIGWPPDKRVEPLVSACLAWCAMKFSERQLESRDIHIDKVRREKSHPKLSRRAAKQRSERAWGCERQQFRNRRQQMSDVEDARTRHRRACLSQFDLEQTSNFQGASRSGTISFRFGLPPCGAAIVYQFWLVGAGGNGGWGRAKPMVPGGASIPARRVSTLYNVVRNAAITAIAKTVAIANNVRWVFIIGPRTPADGADRLAK